MVAQRWLGWFGQWGFFCPNSVESSTPLILVFGPLGLGFGLG